MVFSSIEFLFAFLPAALLLQLVSPRPLRNATLLLSSLVFYTWGVGQLVGLLFCSVSVNYVLGLLVARPGLHARARRACIFASVAVNLAILGVFKYANFAVAQWNLLEQALGRSPVEWAELALPIGISFYTFQSMSYVFDVSRGEARALKNPVDFALYVVMFPQLIAGPIVRFHQIADQLRARTVGLHDASQGVLRFCFGLAKKVIVADSVGAVADAAFGTKAVDLSTAAAWIGLVAYTLQIYFDFSAYSDMAIGLGRMFGFRLPENFDRPYSSLSITDFWRRWHMTLSAWFRDYVFIPMGGSRGTSTRTVVNLTVVFLLCGVWHGAAWTFVLWGLYHGALLGLERVGSRRYIVDAPRPALARATTLLLVMLGWVLFRADDVGHALQYGGALFGAGHAALSPDVALALTTKNTLVLALASGVFLLPRDWHGGMSMETGVGVRFDLARAALLGVALPYLTLLVMSGSYSPFLYFQF